MITNPKLELDTGIRPGFIPRVVDGRMTLDLERLTETMALLEDYVDCLLALEDPPPAGPGIEEEGIQLRVASL